METISVQKREHKQATKTQENVDWELVESFKRSLEDLKAGRFTEWKPKRVK